jgi:hypothetical protein
MGHGGETQLRKSVRCVGGQSGSVVRGRLVSALYVFAVRPFPTTSQGVSCIADMVSVHTAHRRWRRDIRYANGETMVAAAKQSTQRRCRLESWPRIPPVGETARRVFECGVENRRWHSTSATLQASSPLPPGRMRMECTRDSWMILQHRPGHMCEASPRLVASKCCVTESRPLDRFSTILQ